MEREDTVSNTVITYNGKRLAKCVALTSRKHKFDNGHYRCTRFVPVASGGFNADTAVCRQHAIKRTAFVPFPSY